MLIQRKIAFSVGGCMNSVTLFSVLLILSSGPVFASLSTPSPCSQNPLNFKELDLVIEESLENFFYELRRRADLRSIEYRGSPRCDKGVLAIETSVWGEEEMTRNGWGLYGCLTRIQEKSPYVYNDLGTECWLELD